MYWLHLEPSVFLACKSALNLAQFRIELRTPNFWTTSKSAKRAPNPQIFYLPLSAMEYYLNCYLIRQRFSPKLLNQTGPRFKVWKFVWTRLKVQFKVWGFQPRTGPNWTVASLGLVPNLDAERVNVSFVWLLKVGYLIKALMKSHMWFLT